LNYYEHHIGDYDSATSHLSMLEDAAYSRLMRLYYRKELPIPADTAEACRLIRAHSKDERKAVESVLREFFKLEADGWHQTRCDGDIDRFQKKADRNREVGKLGGRPRKTETQKEPTNNHGGYFEEPKHNPLQSPDTRPQTPSTKETVPVGTGGAGAPPQASELIFGLGVPLLTAANVTERNCRSMLGLMRKTHGDGAVLEAIQRCAEEKPLEPVAWLQGALKQRALPTKFRNGSATDADLAALNATADAEARRRLFGADSEIIDA
jgi:uncharacterized protein YdaU (DUF1376 family)